MPHTALTSVPFGPVARAVAAALAFAACAEQSITSDRDATDDLDAPGETDDSGIDDSPYVGPHFFRIDADVDVVAGAVVAETATVNLTWYTIDASPYGADAACSPTVLEAGAGPTTPNASGLLAWWQLSLQATDDDPCPWAVPSPEATGDTELPQLVIGIGALDARLGPALDAADVDPEASVYGLYTLLPGSDADRLLTFGAAGTQGNWGGADLVVEAPPLPDGRYELRTLVLLPVPEARR